MNSLEAIEEAIKDVKTVRRTYRHNGDSQLQTVLTSHLAMLEFMKACWVTAQNSKVSL